MSTRPGIRRRLTSRACPERAQRVEGRDVRVVEGARLESVCRGNSTVGSNPTLSAKPKPGCFLYFSQEIARACFSLPTWVVSHGFSWDFRVTPLRNRAKFHFQVSFARRVVMCARTR